jgi:hypothetical protein
MRNFYRGQVQQDASLLRENWRPDGLVAPVGTHTSPGTSAAAGSGAPAVLIVPVSIEQEDLPGFAIVTQAGVAATEARMDMVG